MGALEKLMFTQPPTDSVANENVSPKKRQAKKLSIHPKGNMVTVGVPKEDNTNTKPSKNEVSANLNHEPVTANINKAPKLQSSSVSQEQAEQSEKPGRLRSLTRSLLDFPKKITLENAKKVGTVSLKLAKGMAKNLTGVASAQAWKARYDLIQNQSRHEDLVTELLESRQAFLSTTEEDDQSNLRMKVALDNLKLLNESIGYDRTLRGEALEKDPNYQKYRHQRKMVADILIANRTRKAELRQGIAKSMDLQRRAASMKVVEKSLSPALLAMGFAGAPGVPPSLFIRGAINTRQKQIEMEQTLHRKHSSASFAELPEATVMNAVSQGLKEWYAAAKKGETGALLKGGLYAGTILFGLSASEAAAEVADEPPDFSDIAKINSDLKETGITEDFVVPDSTDTPAAPTMPEKTPLTFRPPEDPVIRFTPGEESPAFASPGNDNEVVGDIPSTGKESAANVDVPTSTAETPNAVQVEAVVSPEVNPAEELSSPSESEVVSESVYTAEAKDNFWDISEGQTNAEQPSTAKLILSEKPDKLQALIDLTRDKINALPQAERTALGFGETASDLKVGAEVQIEKIDAMMKEIASEKGWLSVDTPDVPAIEVSDTLTAHEYVAEAGDKGISYELKEVYPEIFSELSGKQWLDFVKSVNSNSELLKEANITSGDIGTIFQGDTIALDKLAAFYLSENNIPVPETYQPEAVAESVPSTEPTAVVTPDTATVEAPESVPEETPPADIPASLPTEDGVTPEEGIPSAEVVDINADELGPNQQLSSDGVVEVLSEPSGARLVHVGSFDTVEKARQHWMEIREKMGDIMEGKERTIERATSGDRSFYRLRVHGFSDLSEARQFSTVMVGKDLDAIPVTIQENVEYTLSDTLLANSEPIPSTPEDIEIPIPPENEDPSLQEVLDASETSSEPGEGPNISNTPEPVESIPSQYEVVRSAIDGLFKPGDSYPPVVEIEDLLRSVDLFDNESQVVLPFNSDQFFLNRPSPEGLEQIGLRGEVTDIRFNKTGTLSMVLGTDGGSVYHNSFNGGASRIEFYDDGRPELITAAKGETLSLDNHPGKYLIIAMDENGVFSEENSVKVESMIPPENTTPIPENEDPSLQESLGTSEASSESLDVAEVLNDRSPFYEAVKDMASRDYKISSEDIESHIPQLENEIKEWFAEQSFDGATSVVEPIVERMQSLVTREAMIASWYSESADDAHVVLRTLWDVPARIDAVELPNYGLTQDQMSLYTGMINASSLMAVMEGGSITEATTFGEMMVQLYENLRQEQETLTVDPGLEQAVIEAQKAKIEADVATLQEELGKASAGIGVTPDTVEVPDGSGVDGVDNDANYTSPTSPEEVEDDAEVSQAPVSPLEARLQNVPESIQKEIEERSTGLSESQQTSLLDKIEARNVFSQKVGMPSIPALLEMPVRDMAEKLSSGENFDTILRNMGHSSASLKQIFNLTTLQEGNFLTKDSDESFAELMERLINQGSIKADEFGNIKIMSPENVASKVPDFGNFKGKVPENLLEEFRK